ncbi:MAG: hypothetical protein IT234_04410, partial [Bacteroidia bacterium]|nr:hypothetical protein [Bacteroidia bacterium]
MKKLLPILLILGNLILIEPAQAQLPGFNWAHSYNGTVVNTCINSNNEIYFTGGGPSTFGSNVINGSYLVKKAADGSIIWAIDLGIDANAMCLDKQENIIIFTGSGLNYSFKKYSPTGNLLNTYSFSVSSGSGVNFQTYSMCTDS